jgi:hypothetical protein
MIIERKSIPCKHVYIMCTRDQIIVVNRNKHTSLFMKHVINYPWTYNSSSYKINSDPSLAGVTLVKHAYHVRLNQ